MSKKGISKGVSVRISEEVDRILREYIIRKYGTFRRGLYKYEVERILREYISKCSSSEM